MFWTFGSVHNTKNKLDGIYAWVRYNNRKQTRWKYLGCSRSSLTAALWLCCFGYSSSLLDCMNGQEDDQYFRTLGMGSIVVGMIWREGRARTIMDAQGHYTRILLHPRDLSFILLLSPHSNFDVSKHLQRHHCHHQSLKEGDRKSLNYVQRGLQAFRGVSSSGGKGAGWGEKQVN